MKDLNNAFTFLESCPFHLFVQLSDSSFCFLLANPDIFVSLSHYLRSIFLTPWLFVFLLSDLSITPCKGVQYSRCRCIRAIKSMITVFLHQVCYCCNYCLSTYNFSLCHVWYNTCFAPLLVEFRITFPVPPCAHWAAILWGYFICIYCSPLQVMLKYNYLENQKKTWPKFYFKQWKTFLWFQKILSQALNITLWVLLSSNSFKYCLSLSSNCSFIVDQDAHVGFYILNLCSPQKLQPFFDFYLYYWIKCSQKKKMNLYFILGEEAFLEIVISELFKDQRLGKLWGRVKATYIFKYLYILIKMCFFLWKLGGEWRRRVSKRWS